MESRQTTDKKRTSKQTMHNWVNITSAMALTYGTKSAKGEALTTLCQLCKKADLKEDVTYFETAGKVGIKGSIPSCMENGSDFCQEAMRGRLKGLETRYPDLCRALITHDLNVFEIESIGALITAIRLD